MYCPFCGAEYNEQQQDQTFTRGVLHTRLVGSVHVTAHLQCILENQTEQQIKSRRDNAVVRDYNLREAALHPVVKKLGSREKMRRREVREAASILSSERDVAFEEFKRLLATGEISMSE